MKEKESKPSLLTWEAAAIVLASVGAGYILGSGEVRDRIGKEARLCCQGFRNVMKKREDGKKAEEFRLKARKMLAQVFPQGLRTEE